VVSLRHDALYVRLLRQPDGVAVGRVAMPRLPSSRRQILLGSGRSNTTPFVSSTVKVVPTDLVLNGSADFAIEIDSQERIETSAGRAAKPEAQPPASPADGRQKPARTEPARDDARPDHDRKGQPEAPSGDD
jgi:hypothetical protein